MAYGNGEGSSWPGRHSDPEVNYWREREIRRLWRESVELCGLSQWIPMPDGSFTVAIPAIATITLGDPTVMTIQLRPCQRIAHIEAAASDIAANMDLAGLRAKPFRNPWILVELLAVSKPGTPVATPTPEGWVAPVPARRRGLSEAWTRRWHVGRLRRPRHPS